MARVAAWLQAARPPAQTNIAPSLILGQVLGFAATGRFSWSIFGWLVAFGIFDHLYIVFANDVADVETDLRNRTATPFSGGSRVIPEGVLTLRQLGIAATVAAVLLALVSSVLSLLYARPWSPMFAFAALVLLWAYSYPPLRLSYRGGGELLQVIGVGVVLPLFGYYAQVGSFRGFPTELLLTTLPFQLAGAIATSLPDAPSDAECEKNTLAVVIGVRPVQQVAIGVQLVGLAFATVIYPWPGEGPARLWISALPALFVAAQIVTPSAVPGERRMLLRVFLILSASLALNVGLIAAAILGR
ncbi:MAG: prenyltransferase [Myxococcota bacterium]